MHGTKVVQIGENDITWNGPSIGRCGESSAVKGMIRNNDPRQRKDIAGQSRLYRTCRRELRG